MMLKSTLAKILKKLSSAMAEAEIDEGSKWLKYSDLLLAKSRAVEKFDSRIQGSWKNWIKKSKKK